MCILPHRKSIKLNVFDYMCVPGVLQPEGIDGAKKYVSDEKRKDYPMNTVKHA